MGKRPRERFKNICCWGNSSSDSEVEDVVEENSGSIGKGKPKKVLKLHTEADALSREIEELEEKLQSLTSSLDTVEDKYNATEHQIMGFFATCAVEKLERKFYYKASPMQVNTKVNSTTDTGPRISPSTVMTDSENAIPTDPNPVNTNAEAATCVAYQVPSLAYHCRRMFYQDVTSSEDPHNNRRYASELAIKYIHVAFHNVSRGIHNMGLEDYRILPLRKICYKLMVVVESTSKTKDLKITESQEANDKERLNKQFGETSTLDSTSARGRQMLKEKFFDTSVLTDVLHPLQSTQAVLHQEILDTINLPFRVTLRDIMFRNQLNESHAKFLCINLLISLKYVHSLNIVHGQITPTKVVFNQFGYPCLIGVESGQVCDDLTDPESRIEYISPEQIKGHTVTTATDVFQIGILVYSVIYGQSPFKGDTYNKTRANILDETFIPEFDTDTISKDGRIFIRKLLKMNTDNRFKLDSCSGSLDKTVKWFSTMRQHEIRKQTYPSPFKEILMSMIPTD